MLMIYESTAQELVKRIEALVPDHPEILTMESCWDLFKVGLKCSDLNPTMAQASLALSQVQHRSKQRLEKTTWTQISYLKT